MLYRRESFGILQKGTTKNKNGGHRPSWIAAAKSKMADLPHLQIWQMPNYIQPINLFFIILSFIIRIATFMLLAKNKEKKK